MTSNCDMLFYSLICYHQNRIIYSQLNPLEKLSRSLQNEILRILKKIHIVEVIIDDK